MTEWRSVTGRDHTVTRSAADRRWGYLHRLPTVTHAGVNTGGPESASLPASGSLGLSLGRERLGPTERARLEEHGPPLPSPGLGRARLRDPTWLLYLESGGQIDGVDLLDLIGAQYQLLEVQEFQEAFIHQSHLEEEARKLRQRWSGSRVRRRRQRLPHWPTAHVPADSPGPASFCQDPRISVVVVTSRPCSNRRH